MLCSCFARQCCSCFSHSNKYNFYWTAISWDVWTNISVINTHLNTYKQSYTVFYYRNCCYILKKKLIILSLLSHILRHIIYCMIILRFCIIFATIYILSNNNNDYNYKWSGGFKINTMHCLFVMFVIFSEFQMVQNNKLTLKLKVVQCLTAIKHGFKRKLDDWMIACHVDWN